jgi:hypothetical protein
MFIYRPDAIHKQLKWKLTTITPVVVRTVLSNSGFRLLKSNFVLLCDVLGTF